MSTHVFKTSQKSKMATAGLVRADQTIRTSKTVIKEIPTHNEDSVERIRPWNDSDPVQGVSYPESPPGGVQNDISTRNMRDVAVSPFTSKNPDSNTFSSPEHYNAARSKLPPSYQEEMKR